MEATPNTQYRCESAADQLVLSEGAADPVGSLAHDDAKGIAVATGSGPIVGSADAGDIEREGVVPVPTLIDFDCAGVDLRGPDSAVEAASEPIAALVARLTVLTATKPALATKTFSKFCGSINKGTSADISEGTFEMREVTSLADLAALLESLRHDQCLLHGVAPRSPIGLMTKRDWMQAGQPDSHVPRTKEAFAWPDGPAVLMLDVDAPKDGTAPLDRDALLLTLRSAVPGLQNAAMLWWPSTSSCIFDETTGKEVYGVRGLRGYMLVGDGKDIERAGKALLTHLWAAGHGHVEVSASGALLERGILDGSVWQPQRLDFGAGALCHAPLVQRRGPPMLIPGDCEFVDTARAIPDPSPDVLERAEAAKATAKAALVGEAARVRGEWVEARANQIVQCAEREQRAVTPDVARAQAVRAIERGVLPGDWPLTIVTDGARQVVSVLEALDHPATYHGALTLDPIESGYDGGRSVGKLYLYGARPVLHSFAHGGTTYRLERQPERIELTQGGEHAATEELLDRCRRAPDVYDFGSELVQTDGEGRLHRFAEYSLRHWVGGAVMFYTTKKSKEGIIEIPQNPPQTICKTVMALGASRKLRPLTAVLTAPTLRPDGTVLALDGYDDQTGFLLESGESAMPVPVSPTRDQAQAALELLWRPFAEFPFVGPLDRAAHLAALLTAAVRPALPTAPAFGWDAPSQGSGKTLLASCVAVLATGEAPDIWPNVTGRDSDEELRKRVFSALLDGRRTVFLDNLLGTFDSGSLAGVLTAEVVTDRVLGRSGTTKVPNKILFLLSGNNLEFAGDMVRRVLVCRIDPQIEAPFARLFALSPMQYCRANRQAMVAAALTLIRFYLSSDAGRLGAGSMASYDAFDAWVRQTIIHVDRELAPGQFGDIMDLVRDSQASDPERETLAMLLATLRAKFAAAFTAADVAAACAVVWRRPYDGPGPTTAEKALADVMDEFRRGRDVLTARVIGMILKNRKDRIAGGLRLVARIDSLLNAMTWRVEDVAAG